MEETGIIERVTEPKEWCAPRVSVQKSNGKLRICVDLRRLNSAVKLSRLVLPTLEDIAPKPAGTRYFSKLDRYVQWTLADPRTLRYCKVYRVYDSVW